MKIWNTWHISITDILQVENSCLRPDFLLDESKAKE